MRSLPLSTKTSKLVKSIHLLSFRLLILIHLVNQLPINNIKQISISQTKKLWVKIELKNHWKENLTNLLISLKPEALLNLTKHKPDNQLIKYMQDPIKKCKDMCHTTLM